MLIAWWFTDISLAAGIVLGFLVVSAELVALIRKRSNLAGSTTIEAEFVSPVSQKKENNRIPVAVSGENIDTRD